MMPSSGRYGMRPWVPPFQKTPTRFKIYEATKTLLTVVIGRYFPQNLDEAEERLIAELPLKEKSKVKNPTSR
jgi:hypothetical protein